MQNGYVVTKITQAMLELLAEQPLAAITVSSLVRRAGVGRASFYRHFDSREAVVHRYLAILLEDWGRGFEAAGKPETLGPSLLAHFYAHREFYLLLYRNGLSGYLFDAIRGVMALDQKPETEVYPLSLFAGGLYGLVYEWMRRGMEHPLDIPGDVPHASQ